jgi:hypothetical protein
MVFSGQASMMVSDAQASTIVLNVQTATIVLNAQTSTIVSFENSQNTQHSKDWLRTKTCFCQLASCISQSTLEAIPRWTFLDGLEQTVRPAVQ